MRCTSTPRTRARAAPPLRATSSSWRCCAATWSWCAALPPAHGAAAGPAEVLLAWSFRCPLFRVSARQPGHPPSPAPVSHPRHPFTSSGQVTNESPEEGAAASSVAVTDLRNKLVAGAFSIAHVQHVVCAFGAVAVVTGAPALPGPAAFSDRPARRRPAWCCMHGRAAASHRSSLCPGAEPGRAAARCPALSSAAGSGRLVTLREVELPAQLDALFRRSLYKLALQVGGRGPGRLLLGCCWAAAGLLLGCCWAAAAGLLLGCWAGASALSQPLSWAGSVRPARPGPARPGSSRRLMCRAPRSPAGRGGARRGRRHSRHHPPALGRLPVRKGAGAAGAGLGAGLCCGLCWAALWAGLRWAVLGWAVGWAVGYAGLRWAAGCGRAAAPWSALLPGCSVPFACAHHRAPHTATPHYRRASTTPRCRSTRRRWASWSPAT
jgi:hypothetical protein